MLGRTKLIYLVGVDHVFQHDGNLTRGPKKGIPVYRDEFRDFIVDVGRTYGVDLITEEWCAPAHNQLLNASTTMGKLAAEKLGVTHCYIEPCGEDRERLGLPTTRYDDLSESELARIYEVKETYWLKELKRLNRTNPLHICGAGHVDRFSALLKGQGFQNTVINACWGAGYLSNSHNYNQDGERAT